MRGGGQPGARPRPRPGERQRQRLRPRPPDRCHRLPHGGDDAPRAAPPRRHASAACRCARAAAWAPPSSSSCSDPRDSPAVEPIRQPADLARLFDLTRPGRHRHRRDAGHRPGRRRRLRRRPGAKVVVASRKADACAETQAASRGARRRGARRADPPGRPRRASRRWSTATVDRFGAIDIVVNNAANALALPVGEFTEAAWDKSFAVNLQGPGVPRPARAARTSKRVRARVDRQRRSRPARGSSRGHARCTPRPRPRSCRSRKSMAAEPRAARHPGQRARARHGRHRHGAQQPARGRSRHGPAPRSCGRAATPTRWSARRCSSRRDASSFMTGQVLHVDGGLVTR